MKKSDSDNTSYNYIRHGGNPRYTRSPEYKPGSGVFGLFITAIIILVIVLVIFLIRYAGNNADKGPAENQESYQELAD